jgi:hypothetical protein
MIKRYRSIGRKKEDAETCREREGLEEEEEKGGSKEKNPK